MTEVWAEPTSYTVCAVPETVRDWDAFEIKVERVAPGRWAVRRRHRCLTVDGAWEYEPTPSERDDDFKARARFDLDTALKLAKQAAPTLSVNGYTAARAAVEWAQEEGL